MNRDVWDEAFAAPSTRSNNALVLVLGGRIRLAAWLGRRVLWVLTYVGHIATGFLSRPMEYHAERYEAPLVGRWERRLKGEQRGAWMH